VYMFGGGQNGRDVGSFHRNAVRSKGAGPRESARNQMSSLGCFSAMQYT
jgi:hypothetical protein